MGQRDAQRGRTRAAIVAEAARQFEARGYLGATMRNIADELGVTVGALFFHFRTKESIATELLGRFYERWAALAAEARSAPGSRLEALVRMSVAVAEMYRDDTEVAAAVRLVRDRAVISEDLPAPYLGWIATATEFVAGAQAAGEVREELDAGVIGYQFVCLFFGNQHISGDLTGRTDLPERLLDAWGILVPAVVRPGVDLAWIDDVRHSLDDRPANR